MYAVTAVSLRPISGILNDKGFSRTLIFLGSMMMTLSFLTYLLSKDLSTLFIGRALQGLSIALFIPTSLYLASIGPENIVARRIVNRSFLISLAATLGPLLGGFLVSVGSWKTLFLGGLLITLIPLYSSYKIYKIGNEHRINLIYKVKDSGDSSNKLEKILEKKFILILIINFLFSSSYASLIIFMPAHHKINGLEPWHTASFFTISSVTNLSVRLLYSRLIRNEVLIKYAFAGLSLSSLAVFIISINPSDTNLIYLAAPLSGAGMGFTIPSLQSLALTSLNREVRGVGSSLYTVMFDLANMISPPLLITLTHRYDEAIRYSVAVVMISLIILFIFSKESRRK